MAVAPAGDGEVLVEVFEMIDPQATQRHITDGRQEISVDHPGVAVGGGGADLAAFAR